MFKNSLIIAGLLSLMSLSAQAVDIREIITQDTELNGISGIVTTEGNGGAISNSGYNLILNGEYSGNTLENLTGQAVFGGAVFQSGGNLTINDGVIFDGNTVSSKSQSYPDWSGLDSASGGAVFITGADAQLNSNGTVKFTNNKTLAVAANDESNGGAIHIESIESANFDNVVFDNNSSNNRGGAVYVGDSEFNINGKGEFSNNTSKTGGALYVLDTTGKTVVNTGVSSTFEDNTAAGNGGAIANFDGTINVGKNNTFNGNNSEGNGGAIYNSNWQKTSVTNISGGTTFSKNTAADKGGAIYNSGIIALDTSQGNITFSDNLAKDGSDVYLDGENSRLVINGSDSSNKVVFGSNNSIAGDGNIIHQSAGTVEFKDNKDVGNFNGTYLQTSGKTSLNNSNMFNKYDIEGGELELQNGSNATIDNTDKIFNGSAITVGSKTDNKSILNIGTDSDKVSIDKNVAINIQTGGVLNIENGTVVLNSNDKWQGDIKTTAESSLILDKFVSNSPVGNYIQDGGSLILQNASKLLLSGSESAITGGSIQVNSGNLLSIAEGAEIGGNAESTIYGSLNVDGGILNSTGVTDITQNGVINISNKGNVTLHDYDKWSGSVNLLDKGVLNLNNISEHGALSTDKGELNLSNTTLTIAENSNIAKDTDVSFDSTNTIHVNGGSVALDGTEWGGKITLDKGTLNYGSTTNGILEATGGKLVTDIGSSLTINSGSYIEDGVLASIAGDLSISGADADKIGFVNLETEILFPVMFQLMILVY